MKLTLKQGQELVKLARKAISDSLENNKTEIPNLDFFKDKRGVFVTLEFAKSKDLRGCDGFSEPIFKLGEAVVKSAVSASKDDVRFLPLTKEELDRIVIEVTVLTEPKLIKVEDPKDYFNKIDLGVDGLIVEKEGMSGLLLPQVPIDWEWDAEEFLDQTCIKAGLTQECWANPDAKVSKFQAEIFVEEVPNGKIVERKLVKRKLGK